MIEKNLLPIRDRILQAIMELPENRLTRNKYPKAPGVHNTVIKRLVDREALPGVKNTLKICQATGLSADYFYFGDAAAITRLASEFQASYQPTAPAPMDTELVAQIVIDTENYLEDHRLRISHPRKGKLIAMLYEYVATEHQALTPDIIKAYLRLTH